MALLNPINLIPPQYKIFAYIFVVVAIFGAGLYSGYKLTSNHYETVIAKMEKEAADLRAAKIEVDAKLSAALANIKEVVVTKYVDGIKVVKEKEYVYREQATNVVPSQYELSNGWVSLHDSSARGVDADPTTSADGTPSGVKDNQALATVVENYSACQANAEQLTSLQEYVREAKKAVDNTNETIRNLNNNNKNNKEGS